MGRVEPNEDGLPSSSGPMFPTTLRIGSSFQRARRASPDLVAVSTAKFKSKASNRADAGVSDFGRKVCVGLTGL